MLDFSFSQPSLLGKRLSLLPALASYSLTQCRKLANGFHSCDAVNFRFRQLSVQSIANIQERHNSHVAKGIRLDKLHYN